MTHATLNAVETPRGAHAAALEREDGRDAVAASVIVRAGLSRVGTGGCAGTSDHTTRISHTIPSSDSCNGYWSACTTPVR